MSRKRTVVVVPARMGSSRFPGKPLERIAGLPMIEHVRRRVCLSDAADEVVVATCDREILDVVEGYGGRAVMTSDKHERCTDRVEEAVRSLECDIAVMVQGDEPLFNPSILSGLINPLLDDDSLECTNVVSIIKDEADMADEDVVKAVLSEQGNIMCFSRSPIPNVRGRTDVPLYRQTGIAAFARDFLHTFAALPPTGLEKTESVDFMRIIGHGHVIRAVVTSEVSLGVDRPHDIAKAEAELQSDPLQKELFERIMR